MRFILILFDKKNILEHTTEVGFSSLQNKASLTTGIIILTIFLIIWLSCGLMLAYWVKNDLKKRNSKSLSTFFFILLTSFFGFMVYIITNHGERGILENEVNFSEVDDTINFEKVEEFHDEIEETIEEEVEDIITDILEK
ncbi:MAG: hypothetical protein ACFFCV_05470 [Promethearchaeota archaeon]